MAKTHYYIAYKRKGDSKLKFHNSGFYEHKSKATEQAQRLRRQGYVATVKSKSFT